MPSNLLTITELAAEFGLSLRTLRFYEQRGLLKPARIGMSRFYSSRDKLRLQIIIKGKRLGLSISEIDRLFTSSPEDESCHDLASGLSTADIQAKLISTDEQITRLQEASIRLKAALDERRRLQCA